jgi:hypothetical protein
VGGDVPVDSETLLVTDFMNLKIKPIQSFRGVHRGKMYVHIFIGVSICVCTIFLEKIKGRRKNGIEERAAPAILLSRFRSSMSC